MPSPDTLLTPELQAKICKLIGVGNRAVVAAMECGVPQKTYETWVTNGNKGLEPYASFLDASGAARAHAEVTMMATHLEGDPFKGNNTSTAAFNWLKTSRAKHYAEETRISVEVEGQISNFLDLLERRLPEAQYVEILTAWQSESDNRSASRRTLAGPQGNAGSKLLGTADVVDTEGEPTL